MVVGAERVVVEGVVFAGCSSNDGLGEIGDDSPDITAALRFLIIVSMERLLGDVLLAWVRDSVWSIRKVSFFCRVKWDRISSSSLPSNCGICCVVMCARCTSVHFCWRWSG